jgi:hypothetical protein
MNAGRIGTLIGFILLALWALLAAARWAAMM